MDLANRIIDLVAHHRGPAGLALLGLCAFIEYVFPPFPGDIVVVFGAFLVASRGWSAPGVFGAVTGGSIAGFMLVYALGRRMKHTEARPAVHDLVGRFSRHGALYLVINRFLPSLRALFFVAAGMARLPPWKVLVFGSISALMWNALLFALGATAGHNWPRLQQMFLTYGTVAWAIIAVLLLALLARWLWRRRISGR
jgi:membrane protein DedA with SNARE-associated domain